MSNSNEDLRRCGNELYPYALALSDAKASVSYFQSRVIKHAMLVTSRAAISGKGSLTLQQMRLITLNEFCTRLREARAKQRRCQKALDLAAEQLKRRP